MKRIEKYSNFGIGNLILESILVAEPEFKNVLKNMPADDGIADALWTIISDKVDVKTNYNYIGQGGINDEVSFIPDNQYQRFIDKGEDVGSKSKNKSKIGRMIRQIIKDNNLKKNGSSDFSDSDIESFVNKYKSTWDEMHGVGLEIEIVKGDDIIYWYNQNNYFEISGTLGNSCMRSASKSNYMRIYADNPDKISMQILKKEGKLASRALVWKLDDGRTYLDRIYVSRDSQYEQMYNWALRNFGGDPEKMPAHYKGNSGVIKCTLKKTNQEYYPYADSMYFLFQELVDGETTGVGYTTNQYDSYADKKLYEGYLISSIQDTGGGRSVQNCQWSEYLKKWIDRCVAVYARDIGSYVYPDMAEYCSALGEYYLKDNCVYSERAEGWIPKSKAIEHPKFGIILSSMLIDVVVGYTGKETDPINIWNDISDNGESVLQVEQDLKSGGELDHFSPERSPHIRRYLDKFRVVDWTGEDQISFTSYKAYSVKGDLEKYNYRFFFSSGRDTYVTEIDAEVFGIDVDKNNVKWISVVDYRRLFRNSIYSQVIDMINKSSASQDIKSYRLSIANNIDGYLNQEYRDYKYLNILSKEGGNDLLKIYCDKFTDLLEYLNKEQKWGRGRNFDSEFDRSVRQIFEPTSSETEVLEIGKKYFKLLLFIYSLCNDSYDSINYLKQMVESKQPKDYAILDSYIQRLDTTGFSLMRHILRTTFDDTINSYTSRYISDGYGLSGYEMDDFGSYFRSNVSNYIYDASKWEYIIDRFVRK